MPADGTAMPAGAIIKPALDTLEYAVVVLDNGLKAIIVHDPEADKAAAALDVSIGSLLDPDDCLGLAHFTEHMLFFSSIKYPEEDAYSKFVTDHGGHTNAYTASENTNYQFDINWEHLEPALDRFSQFFVAPTISADGVARELLAVDSEHGKNLATDAWRHMQVYKHTANPAHPWARFATGNLLTLRDQPVAAGLDVRQKVVDFHKQYYSADLMRLAVVGRQPLAELEAMVRTYFSAVPNHALPRPTFTSDLFLPEQRRMLCRVVPVREGQAVEFSWQVPSSIQVYRQAPHAYLSHLLGHEGKGSVFALLKALGWASSLVAGESGGGISTASFFYARVELTEEGHTHVEDVGAVLFKYLALLREGGPQEAIWQEMTSLAKLRFNFRDKQSPYAYATSLASTSQDYPDQDILMAMYAVPQVYDAACISETLAHLTVDKVRVLWISKKHEVALTEPWYGTKYDLEPLSAAWLAAWTHDSNTDARLHLPEINPFIPSDFTMHDEEAAASSPHPVPVVITPGELRLWHKCDVTFKVPKAVIYLDFQLPESYASPDSAVMTRLYVKLLLDYLNEVAYPAELAGLRYSISNNQSGFTLTFSGYNHKLRVLLDIILDKIAAFKVLPDRFAIMREEAAKEYANMRYQQPYQWAMYRRELMVQLRRWRIEEYEPIVAAATAEQLTEFVPRLMSRAYVEGMAVGNIAASEAVELAERVQTMLRKQLAALPVFPSQMRDLRAVVLPSGPSSLMVEAGPNAANDNSAVVVVYQVGASDVKRAALTQLCVQLCKRDAFHELRTVEQLGYIVSLFEYEDLGVYDLQFVVQSNAFSASVCGARIDAFVSRLAASMAAKCVLPVPAAAAPAAPTTPSDSTAAAAEPNSDAEDAEASADAEPDDGLTEFERGVSELAKAKLERPKRLGELSARWWSEVSGGGLRFDRREAEVAALRSLTPQELQVFVSEVMLSQATRRKLVVQVRGSAELVEKPAVPVAGATAAAAEAATCEASSSAGEPAVAAGAADSAPAVVAPVGEAEPAPRIVSDISTFKRGCQVHPAVLPHFVAVVGGATTAAPVPDSCVQ